MILSSAPGDPLTRPENLDDYYTALVEAGLMGEEYVTEYEPAMS